MVEIDYRDTLLFYPNADEDKTLCNITNLKYKPVLLIQHHYPTQQIVDICKNNEKEIRKINTIMSKYRRNIDFFISEQLKGETILQEIDYLGVIEELLNHMSGLEFPLGISEIKYKTAIKLANIRKKYLGNLDEYFNLFGDQDDQNSIAYKFYQFFWELPDKREKLRKLVSHNDMNEVKIKYIFVGKLKNEAPIQKILTSIEENREIPDIESDDYNLLVEEFGENFEDDWKQLDNDYYTQIRFMNYYIYNHCSVFYVQRLIEMLLKIPINSQYLWAYSQLSSNFDKQKYHYDRIFLDMCDYSMGGVQRQNINRFFTDILGMSEEDLANIYKESSTDISNMIMEEVLSREDLMRKKPINSILLNYFEYQSLSQYIVYDKRYRVGTFPNSNPYYAFFDDIAREAYSKLLEQANKIAYGNSCQNRTLANYGELERNEIHFVSLLDFKEFLMDSLTNPSEDINNYIENTIKRYFWNINTADAIFSSIIYEPESKELANLVRYTKQFSDIENFGMELPNDLEYEILGKNIVEVKFQIDSLFKELDMINLRDVMNEIQLSDELIPFVRYYDEQRYENIYRVFKESFTNDREDRIPKNVYENWINMDNFTLNLAKITKTKETMKCLTFKLRLCNQIISYDDPLPILEAKQQTRTITDKVREKDSKFTPNPIKKFIVYYRDALKIEHYVEDYLFTPDKKAIYRHKPVFMDVYIFNSDGRMKCRCLFDPDAKFKSQYFDSIYNVVNYFIELVNQLPQCLNRIDYQILCNILNRPNEMYLSKTLNLSSIVQYKYNTEKGKDFNIIPKYFHDTIAELSNYFIIIEPIFMKDTKLEFYLNGKWFKGAVVANVNKDDGTYDINFRNGLFEKIKPYRLKHEGEQAKAQFINFRYKRVSNFKREGPLIELYKKYKSWGLDQTEIIEKIKGEFDISDEEILDLEKKIVDTSKEIRISDDSKMDVNGIDIKLFYSQQEENEKSYNIEIDHYKSLDDFKMIIFLLDVLFKKYYNKYVEQIVEEKEPADIRLDEAEEMDEALEINQDELDAALDILDELLDEDVVEEEKEEEEKAVGMKENPKGAQIVNENILEFDYEMLGNSSNHFLENLYNIDQKQFKWESKDEKKKYTIACQGTKRYPKVLNNQRFANLNNELDVEEVDDSIPIIDGKLPFKAGLGMTYLGFKSGLAENENDVKEEYCKPGEEIDINKRCVSIQYGSQKDQESWQNVFMCPKIWCIVDRIPLHPRHLIDGTNNKDGCKRFISQADVSPDRAKKLYGSMKNFEKLEYKIWRLCRSCGKDILEHSIKCPICKRGVLEEKNTNNIPTKTTSLYVLPKEENYIYPGFIKSSKHPLGIPSVCCFNNPNTKLSEKFNIVEKRQHNVNAGRYIQTFGKMLDRGRIGQLPLVFANFFGLTPEYFSTPTLMCSRAGDPRFYRFGVEQNNNNVLDCMRAILLNNEAFKENPNILVDKMLKNVDSNIIRDTPLLEFAMRSTGPNNISPLQNFMEYLMSSNYKYDFSLFQFFNRDMTWMNLGGLTDIDKNDLKIGFNIFILSINDDGKLSVEIPAGYIQPFQLGFNKSKCIILLKNQKTLDFDSEDVCEIENKKLPLYEPIFSIKFRCAENEGGRDELYDKFFQLDNPVIQKIIQALPQDNSSLSSISNEIFNKIPIKPMDRFDISWLEKSLNTRKIMKIVLDTSVYIIGAVLDNGLYIPLYPSSYTNRIDYPIINYLDYLDSSELLSYGEAIDKINQLISNNPDMEWLRPNKVVLNNKNQLSGFLLITNVIIPFEPIDSVDNMEFDKVYLDFRNVELQISKSYRKIKYSPKITFEDLIRENFNIVDMIPKVVDNVLIGIWLNNSDKKIKNLYIPLMNENYNQDIHGKKQKYPSNKRNFTQLVQDYQLLYQQTLGRIHCRPVAFQINDNKIIERIYLETNDDILVFNDPKNKGINPNLLGERDPNTHKFFAHKIHEVELEYLINNISAFDWNRYDMSLSDGDSRVHFIQSLNYKKNSYQRFRFEIAQILDRETKTATKGKEKILVEGEELSDKNLSYKQRIIKILDTPQSSNKKRAQILSIIEKLISMYMDVSDSKDSKIKNEVLNLDILESCLNHDKDTCNNDPFCIWRPFGETKEEYMKKVMESDFRKPLKTSEIQEFLGLFGIQPTDNDEENRRMYFEKKYEYMGLQKYLENYNKKPTIKSRIDAELRLKGYSISSNPIDNVRTFVRLIKKGQCRFKLMKEDNVEKDDVKKLEFVRKIVEELVRNTIKRNEILGNKIRLVETKLSYHVYGGEFLFTQAEIKSKFHLSIYCKELNNRLKILDFFTRNSSLYEYEIPDLPPLELSEKIKVYKLVREDIYLDFNQLENDLFYVPDGKATRLIKILDNRETNDFILDIFRQNTNVDRYRVTNIENNVEFLII